MANRQEMQTGHDLIVFTNRINEILFTVSAQLQGIIKIRVPKSDKFNASFRDATPDEVVALTKESLQKSNKKYSNWIESFLTVAPPILPSNGLGHFGVLRSVIDMDIAADKTNRSNLNNAMSAPASHVQLETVGANLERDSNPLLNINMATIKVPENEKIINTCNDCLDTASYELKNINPYTGDSMLWTVDQIRARVADRFKVVIRDSGRAVFSRNNRMAAVATQAANDLGFANTYTKLLDIADYIDRDIPKLPLIRRHWGL